MLSYLQLDINFLIYRFYSSLGTLYNSYVSHYVQTHDAFNKEGKTAFTLKYAICQFLNTCKNSTNNASSEFLQALVAARKPKPTKCSHCKRPKHTVDKCWEKHPHLKPAHITQRESQTKQK